MTALMTERWVGSRDSAKQAAGALVKLTFRRPRWWVQLAVIEVAFAFLIGVSFDERYGTATRAVFGSLYALVPTLGINVIVLGSCYLVNRRAFRQVLHEGAVLESSVGPTFVVLRGAWAETRLSFDGIASVESDGRWVILRPRGSSALSVWPAALFPAAVLARMEGHLEGSGR